MQTEQAATIACSRLLGPGVFFNCSTTFPSTSSDLINDFLSLQLPLI